MSTLFEKLRQRNVFRVAAAYAVLSWILLQVVALLTPALHLPDSLLTILSVILLLGLVPSLIFSWVYELTPDGLKKESEISHDPAFKQQTGQKLNVAVIIMLVMAVGLLALDRLVLVPLVARLVLAGVPRRTRRDDPDPARRGRIVIRGTDGSRSAARSRPLAAGARSA